MAFIKNGDAIPIEGYYGDDGKETCSECGQILTVIAIDQDQNKLVCENCEDCGCGVTDED